MFKGSFTALITPFQPDGTFDEKAFERFVEWQISEGTEGLVPTGTTGESPTLSVEEQKRVIELCVKTASGRVPVMAGTGSNNTVKTIELTRYAKEIGADAALLVVPYYNKPTQEGLFQHFTAIADAVDLPLVLYNIPGRSTVSLSVATISRLAKHPNIVGIKDATANLALPIATKIACGQDFCQLSGEDLTVVSFLAAGGSGCISVTANIAPALCASLHRFWRQGKISEAMNLQQKLFPLHEALFTETNPVPVKYAAGLLGFGAGNCRLPLTKAASETQKTLQILLHELKLIA